MMIGICAFGTIVSAACLGYDLTVGEPWAMSLALTGINLLNLLHEVGK